MKKYLQKNIYKEAKELISMQTKLEEYDHQNKCLNRQVLILLQENTRLKMEKVQNNIINICPTEEKKRAMQMICERRLEKYKYQELMEDERSKGSPSKGKNRVVKMGQKKEVTLGKENKGKVEVGMDKLEEDVFFTFGTNSGNNVCKEKVGEEGDQIVLPLQKSHTQLLQKSQTASNMSQSCISVQVTPQNIDNNRSSQKKCDFPSNKKLRTTHSIRPSPQITHLRSDKNQNTTPTKNPKEANNACYQSRQKKRQNESTEKRKRYIQVLSIHKTPSRPNPLPQEKL